MLPKIILWLLYFR